jgi:16S rRNA (uracil1498-N3)-methyltransferase
MQRYFATLLNNDVILNDNDKNHLLIVMRSQINDDIEVVIDNILYIATIKSTSPLKIVIKNQKNVNNELNKQVVLIISLLKGEKNDFVVQKATELGVSEIYFIRSEHSIGKIKKEEETKKLVRFQKIAKEAAQQSKRNNIPQIKGIIDFKSLINVASDIKLIASLVNESKNVDVINAIKTSEKIAILIGPEGGFTLEEEKVALECGFIPFSLGKRVLRAETAAIYSMSVLSFLLENN